MKCNLYILDEVNVAFEGLKDKHINKIIKDTKLTIKGAHMTPAFKMKLTDGKESNFHENGHTYFYMLDKVLPMVEGFGYDIEVEDFRESIPFNPEHIDDQYIAYTGMTLYYYQLAATNAVIDNERGIFEIPTSGGKGVLSAVITKIYNEHLDFIIIVPTEKLVKQIREDFNTLGLEIGAITKGLTPKKKAEAWSKKNVVCTWRLLNNNKDKLKRFGGFVYDEAHIMGDVMFNILETDLSHAMIRVGMTGTLPPDKLKREKIHCHIGGETLIKLEPHELQKGGYISTCDIEMYPIDHKFKDMNKGLASEWDWYQEEAYLHNNKKRFKLMADMIYEIPKDETTLILCSKEVAQKLSKETNLDLIYGEIDEDIREGYYYKLEHEKGYKLVTTYETVGTGLSINEITTVVAIDMGKNEIRIIQGIGRGLRKDGKDNHLKVIDIYSKLTYFNNQTKRWNDFSYSGKAHVSQRKTLYKKLKYPFKEMNVTTIDDKRT